MMGLSTAIGETTTLAWIKGFPGQLVGAWSSGTGLSGVGGTLAILLLKAIPFFDDNMGFVSITNLQIFLVMSLFLVLYSFAFLWLYRQKSKYPFIPEE